MVFVNAAIILYCIIRGITNPFIALFGILFVSMTNPGEVYPILATVHAERIMAIVGLVGLFLQPRRIILPPVTKRLLIFWGTMFVSIPLAFWPGGAFNFTINFGKTLLYHIMMVNSVDSWDRFKKMLVILTGLIGFIAFESLWAYAHGMYDPNALIHGLERAEGLTSSNSNPNALGMTMVSALPIMALTFYAGKFRQKLFAGLIGIAALVTVVITASRMSFTALLALILLYCFTRKKGLLYLPLLLVMAMATWIFVPNQYKERYSAIADIVKGQKDDASYDAHAMTRLAGYHMFLDNPITGVGAGQFAVANGTKYWPGPGVKQWLNSHNLYIQLASELGLVGIFAWIVFIRYFFKSTLDLKRRFKELEMPPAAKYFPTVVLFCLFTLFLSGWTGHNLYRTLWYQLCALIYALQSLADKGQIPGFAGLDAKDTASEPITDEQLVDS